METFTLLPPGVVEPVGGAPELWQAMEQASKRVDAVLGLELVLSLPMADECPSEVSVAMAHKFVRSVIVDRHQLAATLAVHGPHGTVSDEALFDGTYGGPDGDRFARAGAMARVNLHVHVMISPRQVTPAGLAKKRYTALDPINRGAVVYGRAWGRLWAQFQNRFFASIGSALRVTPNPPVALIPVPLPAVRRWRNRMGRTNSPMNGRALLVNPERERENRAIVETITGALQCFHAPFTRDELDTLYHRHVPSEIANDLTEATIGLDCVTLVASGSNVEWYASIYQVQRELRAFGLAILLGERWKAQRDVSRNVGEGFADCTRGVLVDIFGGPDLTIIKTWGAADLLAADIARIGEDAGLTPVTIATAAGHPAPTSVVRHIIALRTKMVSDAVIIVDDADALVPQELSLVLAAAVAGNNRLVLIRRQEADWTPLALLDLIGHHALTVHWSAMPARSMVIDAVPGFLPPTTAITLPLADASQDRALPGWPLFAVDLLGEVVTSARDIVRTIGLLATAPGVLEWGEINPTEMSRRLAERSGIEEASTPADRFHVAATALEQTEIEEAAFSTLDNRDLDNGIDHEDIEYDWVDESEPDLDPDEIHDVYQDTELDQT